MIKYRVSNSGNMGGFTIIETMVVLAIIVVILGIAIPSYVTLIPGYRLKAAGQDLYGNLQSAKMLAIKNNTLEDVSFDTAAGTYTKADGTVLNLNDVYDGYVSYGRHDSDPNVVTYTDDKVTFNARGMTQGPTGAVFLKNTKNQYIKIETQPSGVITYKKWNGSAWE